jgi:hypothetical protein
MATSDSKSIFFFLKQKRLILCVEKSTYFLGVRFLSRRLFSRSSERRSRSSERLGDLPERLSRSSERLGDLSGRRSRSSECRVDLSVRIGERLDS